ncbi:MAG: HAD family hydrolase [Candidatus Sungbacteria bacterium]|nr:HAD family hydrolase [Candidatus Sungbacteria bacterium]
MVFVFDGDDTLWMNEWQYSQTYADFFSYLYATLGDRTPNFHYIRERYFQIEGELYKTCGVRRGRVAEAMACLHKEICAWIEWRWNENLYREEDEEEIRKIGDQPFDYTKLRWVPGAEKTLQTLKAAGHKLCFLSSYDSAVFPKRAGFLWLSRFFGPERIRTTEYRKNKEDFIAVSGWTPNDTSTYYAVGNSESDILPALEINDTWRGIYIPYGSTSKFFAARDAINFLAQPMDHPRVTTIKSIAELLSIL